MLSQPLPYTVVTKDRLGVTHLIHLELSLKNTTHLMGVCASFPLEKNQNSFSMAFRKKTTQQTTLISSMEQKLLSPKPTGQSQNDLILDGVSA